MVKCIRYSTFVLALFCLVWGVLLHDYNFILFFDLFLWVQNLIFSFENIKGRLFFLTFQGAMFLFLLSRPTIGFFRGNNWQYADDGQMIFSLGSIGLSLLCMMFGVMIWEKYQEKKERHRSLCKSCVLNPHQEFRERFLIMLRGVSLVFFVLGIVAYFSIQVDKMLFMQGKDYLAYYTDYTPNTPYPVYLLSSYMPCALSIYLMTLPRKKPTFFVLAAFLLSELPVLVFGKRSQLMLNAIFILLYYFARDFMGDKEKWVGRTEKILLCISIPTAIVLLGVLNYTRSGDMVSLGFFALIIDFFFKQGVSFNVLNIAYAAIPHLPPHQIQLYSFGNFIDYILHGPIAQKFFGASDLGTGNNLAKAIDGHNFSHNMSYVTRGDAYLEGNGWGSSYLLETYADFGWVGIVIYSVLLGVLLAALLYIIKKRNLLSVIALVSLINLFFTPRAGATEFLDILIRPRFWAPVIVCFLGAGLLTRCYSYETLKKKKMITG